MRSSSVSLAKAANYVSAIKFVGGRHPVVAHTAEEAGVHPCSDGSLRPGAAGCSSVEEITKKWMPFKVVPYNNPNKKAASTKGSVTGSPQYLFKNRPLEENEVSSISQLPPRFKTRPIEEQEMEIINNGGI